MLKGPVWRSWQKFRPGLDVESGACGKIARVENGFFRYKSVLGVGLKVRHNKAQSREAVIGCHILNQMAEFSFKPDTA